MLECVYVSMCVCACVQLFLFLFLYLFPSVKSEYFWVSDSVSITVCLTLGCVRRWCLWKILSSLRPPPPCRNGACCGSNSTWWVPFHLSLGDLCLVSRKHWVRLDAMCRVRRSSEREQEIGAASIHALHTQFKGFDERHFYLQYAVSINLIQYLKSPCLFARYCGIEDTIGVEHTVLQIQPLPMNPHNMS